jgi:hypothetical protein
MVKRETVHSMTIRFIENTEAILFSNFNYLLCCKLKIHGYLTGTVESRVSPGSRKLIRK